MCAKALSPLITDSITRKNIKYKRVLTIGSYDVSSYLISTQTSFSKEFGAAQATFKLHNNDGRFSDSGINEINVGDIVSYSVYYGNDLSQEFKKFYGFVNQRSISKSANDRSISIVCLDYISCTQFMDIDLEVEGTKILVENETLTPNYLSSPNDSLSQVFNFVNNSLADNPLPIIMIRNKGTAEEDPLYDGMEIVYDEGQLKLGFPLNAKDNYDVIATQYYFYVKGIYVEDVLKSILSEVDGYGTYLFKETVKQTFIDNHLTETFQNVEGAVSDTLIPNYTSSTIILETILSSNVTAGDTSINVVSTAGFPSIGSGSINGDTFSWTGKTDTKLTGIPATGSYSLNAHATSSYVEYTGTYSPGQVWYLRYSNLISTLTSADFTITGLATEELLKYSFTDLTYNTTSNVSYIGGSAITNASLVDFSINNTINYSTKPFLNFITDSVSLAESITENRYFEFTITPDNGYTINLSSLSFKVGKETSGTYGWGLRSSIDSYVTTIESGTISTTRTTWGTVTINLPSSHLHLRSAVTFRLYFYGDSASFEIDVDDILINGRILKVVDYLDKRNGRIILDRAINTSATIKCYANYSFYTLQSSGIELNRISFRSREVENRFEAIKKLKEYCPPNYVIYTRGDNKIWAKLMSQRTVADFTLQLDTALDYLEDEDLYTRVIFYGKNINPTNLMLGGGCDFVGTGETYKAIATNAELSLLREDGNYYVYGSPISGVGQITTNTIKPRVYVNSVEIDNTSHRIIGQAVALETTTKTETTQKGGGKL
jgi:hypothetical protein